MLDLAVVGHLTIDTIITQKTSKPETRLGGPAAYASLAARTLGATVGIASKVGADFPEKHLKWLKQNRIDTTWLKQSQAAKTTCFTLKYDSKGKRQLWLKAKAPPILPEDVSDTLRAKAILIGSVANETPKETMQKLRAQANILCTDPQGKLRTFSRTGKTILKPPKNPRNMLQTIDIYKSSVAEAKTLTHAKTTSAAMRKITDYGPKIVIVTRGRKGATLMHQHKLYHIPAYPAETVDPTGAGDALIGAFLAEYVKEKEPLWCIGVGAAAASLTTETVGPVKLNPSIVYERATEIHKRLKPSRL